MLLGKKALTTQSSLRTNYVLHLAILDALGVTYTDYISMTETPEWGGTSPHFGFCGVVFTAWNRPWWGYLRHSHWQTPRGLLSLLS